MGLLCANQKHWALSRKVRLLIQLPVLEVRGRDTNWLAGVRGRMESVGMLTNGQIPSPLNDKEGIISGGYHSA
jgi:hypothetical protein